jgi:transposase
LDLCHLDEAGFALTQPTTTTWGERGRPRRVPYEAPQGRRLNVIGGYFSHGPQVGEFQFATFAKVPAPKPRQDGTVGKTWAQVAAEHGLEEVDLGVIDSEVFLAFVWQLAGRPVDAPDTWRRERPLLVVVDNYSVHTSERVRSERRALAQADVHLLYLPAYSPELSRIETHWKATKYYDLPQRSYRRLGDLKQAVELALLRRARQLQARAAEICH